ncbi:MAG: GNAT family N-acetyltransferase [Alphaproteobacteria bacterium]
MITLNPLAPVHAAVAAALHATCFDPAWSEEAVAGLLVLPTCFGLLAVDAAATPPEPRGLILCSVAADEAEVLTVCVRPEDRSRGTGRRLLGAACDSAAAAGARSMFLEVAEDNVHAMAMYETSGFVRVGRRRGYYARRDGAVDPARRDGAVDPARRDGAVDPARRDGAVDAILLRREISL